MGEKKYNSSPFKWRYKNPRGTIYHLIGTFFFMVLEHVYHQICLWHPESICGFCNFDEGACRTVIWYVLAQLWSLTYPPRAIDKGMEIPAPEQGLQAISRKEAWRKQAQEFLAGPVHGCCSFLQPPRLSDGLEGASGSDLYTGKPVGSKPSLFSLTWTRIVMQVIPQRYTLK